jgi:hypothetical protein
MNISFLSKSFGLSYNESSMSIFNTNTINSDSIRLNWKRSIDVAFYFTSPVIGLSQVHCTSACVVVPDIAATTHTALQSCNIETTRENTKL